MRWASASNGGPALPGAARGCLAHRELDGCRRRPAMDARFGEPFERLVPRAGDAARDRSRRAGAGSAAGASRRRSPPPIASASTSTRPRPRRAGSAGRRSPPSGPISTDPSPVSRLLVSLLQAVRRLHRRAGCARAVGWSSVGVVFGVVGVRRPSGLPCSCRASGRSGSASARTGSSRARRSRPRATRARPAWSRGTRRSRRALPGVNPTATRVGRPIERAIAANALENCSQNPALVLKRKSTSAVSEWSLRHREAVLEVGRAGSSASASASRVRRVRAPAVIAARARAPDQGSSRGSSRSACAARRSRRARSRARRGRRRVLRVRRRTSR